MPLTRAWVPNLESLAQTWMQRQIHLFFEVSRDRSSLKPAPNEGDLHIFREVSWESEQTRAMEPPKDQGKGCPQDQLSLSLIAPPTRWPHSLLFPRVSCLILPSNCCPSHIPIKPLNSNSNNFSVCLSVQFKFQRQSLIYPVHFFKPGHIILGH